MPYKFEKIPINNPSLDRRVKLLPEDVEEIKRQFLFGESINQLARIWNVNKRRIQFILFPERHAWNLELRKRRGGSKKYYDREKHNAAMQDHREYKKKLYKQGKLMSNSPNS